MIPKIIHYCWFGGKPMPEDVKSNIASWKKHCSDFKFYEWNESNFDINQNEYCKEAYLSKKWAFVTDYVRLKVLHDLGGIYMDTDVEVVKSLKPLCTFNAVSGYESDTYIQTGTLGASKNNEWINMLLESYNDRHFIKKDGSYDTTTNVVVITHLTSDKYNLNLHGQKIIFGDNMVILPFEYLCAKNLVDGKIYRTGETYTIHHYNGSWLTLEDQYKNNVRMHIRKILPDSMASHVAAYCAAVKYHGFGCALINTKNWIAKKIKNS